MYLSVEEARAMVKVMVESLEAKLDLQNPNVVQKQEATDMLLVISIFLLRGQRPSFGLHLQFRAFAPYFEDISIRHLDTFEAMEKVFIQNIL
jgi:hypothetical protein